MRTCRNLLLVAFALLAARSMAGIGATEAWVTNYVARAISGLSRTIEAEGGTNSATYAGYTFSYEEPTELALRITGDTAASRAVGVTNGLCLALADEDAGVFASPGWVVGPASNCLFLASGKYADGAFSTNGTVRLAGRVGVLTWFFEPDGSNRFCRISRTTLQPSVARRILEASK